MAKHPRTLAAIMMIGAAWTGLVIAQAGGTTQGQGQTPPPGQQTPPAGRGGQLPMIVSGGLSTIAGLGFIAQSGGNDAHLTYIAGYMALGALLYLLWALRQRTHPHPAQ